MKKEINAFYNSINFKDFHWAHVYEGFQISSNGLLLIYSKLYSTTPGLMKPYHAFATPLLWVDVELIVQSVTLKQNEDN